MSMGTGSKQAPAKTEFYHSPSPHPRFITHAQQTYSIPDGSSSGQS
jgi:hypothetical protein